MLSRRLSTRRRLLAGVVALYTAATLATFMAPAWVGLPMALFGEEAVVTHWTAGELVDEEYGRPLLVMAEEFNRAGRRLPSGQAIRVEPVRVNSGDQARELTSRAGRQVPLSSTIPDPTIVTPSVDHWLAEVNFRVGREVIDLAATPDLAVAWVGVATYREMAECLGWPTRDIGWSDILALRQDPRGWGACATAKVEWGAQPLLAFTDPHTSSTARSLLFATYVQCAGKPADQLSPADVSDPNVAGCVRAFQSNVDHYLADTLILASKLFDGPRYGHFYPMEENGLVGARRGIKVSTTSGVQVRTLDRDAVFIYPKDGTVAHNHPGGVVQAPWVTPEQAEAARIWLDYLRSEPQQRRFMEAGFRPAIDLPLTDPISPRFGLDPKGPTTALRPVNAATAAAIMDSWEDVKKPGIATFLLDVSTSMQGAKIDLAKQGLGRALDSMSENAKQAQLNRVGFLTFGDSANLQSRVPVAPLSENKARIGAAIQDARLAGSTALYDAILEAIKMTDAAPGDPGATRGVVVLTDGQANRGQVGLSDLVELGSPSELPIPRFRGWVNDDAARDQDGQVVAKEDMVGLRLAVPTQHPIHIFFVGVGGADLEVGRILSQATSSAYQGATEEDLDEVIRKFGRYF